MSTAPRFDPLVAALAAAAHRDPRHDTLLLGLSAPPCEEMRCKNAATHVARLKPRSPQCRPPRTDTYLCDKNNHLEWWLKACAAGCNPHWLPPVPIANEGWSGGAVEVVIAGKTTRVLDAGTTVSPAQ